MVRKKRLQCIDLKSNVNTAQRQEICCTARAELPQSAVSTITPVLPPGWKSMLPLEMMQ